MHKSRKEERKVQTVFPIFWIIKGRFRVVGGFRGISLLRLRSQVEGRRRRRGREKGLGRWFLLFGIKKRFFCLFQLPNQLSYRLGMKRITVGIVEKCVFFVTPNQALRFKGF